MDSLLKVYKLEIQPEELIKRLPYSEAQTFMTGVEAYPLEHFCPTGKQEEYINEVARSVDESKIPVVLLAAANGIGKTTTSIITALNCIYGAQNGWYDYRLFKNFPFPKLCWYCSTADALRDKIIPLFQKLAIPGTYEEAKEGKTFVSKMTFPKYGWTISFKTYEQDPSTFESADVGILVLDEPAPQPIWNAVKSRRRLGCLTLIAMTPLFTPPYLHDEVKNACDNGDKGYKYIEADVYSACKRRGVRGYLEPSIIDEMVKTCDAEEYEARILGKFAYFSTMIYFDLDRNKHFVDPADYPILPNSVIKQVVDPHDSRPPACIYAALCPNGRLIIFDETPVDKHIPFWEFKRPTTIKEDILAWKDVEDKYPIFDRCSRIRILDRHFGWQLRGKRTFAELYYEEGRLLNVNLDFYQSYEVEGNEESEIHYGHKEVRKKLLPLEDGKPGLVIWNTCYHTWNGLSHYVRKHETTKSAADKPAQSGKIVERYKDFPDLVRYLVCDDVVPVIPKPEKTRYQRELEKVQRNERETGEFYN